MTNRKIVGIIGPAGVGKSTLASDLTYDWFMVRAPFAGPLKMMLETLLVYQGVSGIDIWRMLHGDWKEESSQYFNDRTPRHAMQTLGTEWGRNLISPGLWTEVWKRRWANATENLVVDDVRLVNEAETVRSLGGKIIQVTRHGFDAGIHQSETEYQSITPDLVVENREDEAEKMVAEVTKWIAEQWPE